jgi:hypothetical protein
MKKIIGQKLYELIPILIKNIKDTLKNENLNNCSELSICKEFCTVKIGLPRRTGNTSLCIHIATTNNNVAVITYSPSHVKCFIHEAKKQNKLSLFNEKLITDKSNISFLYGKNIDIIVIDIMSIMSQHQLDRIYKYFGKNKIYFLIG